MDPEAKAGFIWIGCRFGCVGGGAAYCGGSLAIPSRLIPLAAGIFNMTAISALKPSSAHTLTPIMNCTIPYKNCRTSSDLPYLPRAGQTVSHQYAKQL